MANRQRIVWIDALKGFGMMLIIMAHVTSLWSLSLFSYLCYSFIPLFFVSAGFTSRPGTDTFLAYLSKKAKRLLIPYFFYAILLALAVSCIDGEYNLIYKIRGILYARYSLHGIVGSEEEYLLASVRDMMIAPMWFLPSMFVALLWVKLYDDSSRKIMALCVLIAMSVLSYFTPLLLPWSLDTSFLFSLFILAGRRLRPYIKDYGKKTFIIAIALVFAYFLLGKANGTNNISIGCYGERGLLSLPLFFAMGVLEPAFVSLLLLKFQHSFVVRFLQFIGHHSLRIMCIHMFVYRMMVDIFPQLFSTQFSKVGHFIYFIILTALVLMLETLFRKMSEYIPVIRFI